MLTIPIQRNASEFDMCVVLDAENLQRIQEYDPCEISTDKLGTPWRGRSSPTRRARIIK